MRIIGLLALFVLLGALAWSWLGERGSPQSSASRDAAAAAATAPGAPPALPAADATPAPRELVTTIEPGATVQVVAADTNAPVAGAEVRYQPPEFDWQKLTVAEREELSRLNQDDSEAFLARVGRALIADAEGRCRVPLGAQGTRVAARHGERFGVAWVRADQPGEQQLVLGVDRTLHVLVVDAAGQPAPGIDVQAERPGMRWSLGKTDATGRVVKRHTQTYAGDGRAKVTAHPPGGAGPAADVDFMAPPPEVVLRLAAGGTVTVRVLEASGAPVDPRYLDDAVVSLAAFAAKPTDRNEQFDGFKRNPLSAPLDALGVATFSRVTLERYLMAQLGSLPLDARGFAGPTAAVPQVETTLQRDADGALVVGRLLAVDGQPFAERKFRLAYTYANGMGSVGARTDERGRFRCYLGVYPAGQTAVLQFRTEPSDPDGRLAIELPAQKVPKGESDVGDVRLAPLQALVSGRLVRDAGVDVQAVQLQVERRQGQRWSADLQLQTEWQSGGEFTVRGVATEREPLRLVVPGGPFAPVEPLECTAGTTGIEIALRAAAEATAVFLIDEQTPTERFAFRLRRQGERESSDMLARLQDRTSGMKAQRDADGKLRYRWTGLVPGTYQLTVACLGVSEPVARVDAVQVSHGPCADPRLAGIDLRGRVRTLRVRAIDADGQPITDTEAIVVLYCADDECQGFNLGRGVAEILTTAPVDLRVWAPGHRLALVPAVHDDRTIQLQRAPEVRLRVELPAPLPDGFEFALCLVPQLGLEPGAHITLDTGRGMNLDSLLQERVVPGADGASVTVRCPGEYVVEALLNRQGQGSHYLRELTPKSVTLGTGETGEQTTIKVSAEGLERVLQRMRR